MTLEEFQAICSKASFLEGRLAQAYPTLATVCTQMPPCQPSVCSTCGQCACAGLGRDALSGRRLRRLAAPTCEIQAKRNSELAEQMRASHVTKKEEMK